MDRYGLLEANNLAQRRRLLSNHFFIISGAYHALLRIQPRDRRILSQ